MWCPDGYLRWDEFREVCRKASRQFIMRRYGALKPRAEGAPVDHSVEGPAARRSKEHALANFLLSGALSEGLLSCVSASGQPVRIQTKSFAPLVFADDSAVAEIFCSDTLPWRPTDWDEAPPAWWRVWERPLYLFIDDETGTILSTSETALMNFGDKFADQYDYAGHGVPNTPATRDDLKGWLQHELADARALAAQFEGQALCIKADVADRFAASAFGEFVSEVGSQADQAARRSVGRPGKQDLALAAYCELYPDGHKPLVWKQVLKAIKERTGESVSKDTVVRALKKSQQNPAQNPTQKAE